MSKVIINVRVEEQLREDAYIALRKLGISPSQYLRQCLEYVVENEKVPFSQVMLSYEDQELLKILKRRFKGLKAVKKSVG